jgi:hypothetical protein
MRVPHKQQGMVTEVRGGAAVAAAAAAGAAIITNGYDLEGGGGVAAVHNEAIFRKGIRSRSVVR